nr:hypothetical protein [Tanacetum cinerariifolium]
TPAIGFLKPFSCHVMILNTLDNLGKFEAKGDQEVKKDVSSLRYITIPNWVHDALLESSLSKPQDDCSTDVPESSRNSNPTTTSTNPLADQLETLTVETPIPTISSPVLTACLNDSPKPSSDTRLISKRVANQVETPSLDNILTLINRFEDILRVTTNSDDSDGVEADVINMETNITASPTPTLRIHIDHPKSQIIGPVDTLIQTRNKSKEMGEHSFIATIHQKIDLALLQFCLFSCFLSQVEPKKIYDALQDPSWVLKNKKDKRGIVIRNKARLVAQGHTQEEGINYDEVFSPVARIEAIRLFLAYASFMGFTVYQMDVKSAFLYGTINEEVYVMRPPGFQDPKFPVKVYKVEKAMYGLHQAPRACPSFSGRIVSLFDTMMIPQGEGSGTPTEPHHTPSPKAQPTSSTTPSSPTLPSVTTSLILPPAADEHASPLRYVSQGEACPTDSSFRADQDRANIAKTSTLPHDSAPMVTSPAAYEGNEGKAAAERVSDDTKEMATVLTSMDAATVLAMDLFPLLVPLLWKFPLAVLTVGLIFATATVVTPYTRRKGKETMVESETPKKKKVHKQIDAYVARELEEQMARDDQRMEDLNQLWALVKETLNIRLASIIEFPLPEGVPTANEESSHYQKKRDATAVKIALLLKSRRNYQSK